MLVICASGDGTCTWRSQFALRTCYCSTSLKWSKPVADNRMKNGIHPTKQKLIANFLQMGADHDLTTITLESLLDATGISKGSFYYHFDDFDDLIAQANAQIFSAGINRSIESMNAMLADSTSTEDFKFRIRELILDTLTPEGVRQRVIRARIISASMKFPKLHQYIFLEQRRLTDEIAEMFTQAKGQGLVKECIDTKVAAVFIQAYTFGKVVDDMSETPLNSDDWADWIMSILDYKILV